MDKMKYNPLTGQMDYFENPNEIQFSINGVEYSAPRGIKWSQWLNRPDTDTGRFPSLDASGPHILDANKQKMLANYRYASQSESFDDTVLSEDIIIGGMHYFCPCFVDMGLSSGILWATFNIGATCPSEAGGLYATGEFNEKKTYTFENWDNQLLYIKPGGFQSDVARRRWGESGLITTPAMPEFEELLTTTVHKISLSGLQLASRSTGQSILLNCPFQEGVDIVGYYETYDPGTLERLVLEIRIDTESRTYSWGINNLYWPFMPKLTRAVIR